MAILNPTSTDLLREQVIDIVQRRVGIATVPDSPLAPIIEDLAYEIQEEMTNYMNRNDIPDQLKYTWVRLIMGVLSSEYGNDETVGALSPENVTSVKEGDTQISFGSSTSANTSAVISSAVRNIADQLNRFRKMGNV